MSYFCPDLYLKNYQEVTIELLQKNGIKAILLDIDNTVAPYEQDVPSEENMIWFNQLKSSQIQVVFLSNNKKERVQLFAKEAGFTRYYKASKPLLKWAKKALSTLEVASSEVAVMGDQIFTDVWLGKRLGVKTILVPPIKDKTDPFTKFKRILEKPIIKSYYKGLKK